MCRSSMRLGATVWINDRRILLIGLLLAFVVILNRAFLSLVFSGWDLIIGNLILAGWCIFLLPLVSRTTRLRINFIDLLVIVFSGWVLIRALFTEDFPLRPSVGVALYLGTLPAYVLARVVCLNWRHIRWAVWFTWIFLSLFALIELGLGRPLGDLPVYASRLPFFSHRLASSLGSSNHFSIAMTVALIFISAECGVNMISGRRWVRSLLLATLANGTGLLLMFGAGQRAAIFVYLAALALLALMLMRMTTLRKRVQILIVGAALIMLGLLAIPEIASDPDSMVARLVNMQLTAFDLGERSNFERNDRYDIIIRFLSSHPGYIPVGIGVAWTDNFPYRVGLQTFFLRLNEPDYVTTESSFLKLWLELGIIGLAIWYSIMLIGILISLKLAFIESYNPARAAYFGMAVGLLSVVVRSVALQVFDVPLVQLFTLVTIAIVSNEHRKVVTFRLKQRPRPMITSLELT